jgi:serine protease Do
MEFFENDPVGREPEFEIPQPDAEQPIEVPAQQEPPECETQYRGTGAGRKESPFADSPYVMNHSPEQPRYYTPPVEPEKPKKKTSGKVWKKVVAAVLAVALVAGSCGITAAVVNSRWEHEMSYMYQEFNTRMDEMQQQIVAAEKAAQLAPETIIAGAVEGMTPGQVYAQNVHSVVLISCEITTSIYGQTTTGSSAGSGFILTDNGYIVTNHHVVEDATKITVGTYDGQQYAAKVVGSDATNDVAVLKVEAENLDAVELGSSSALAVGDQVVAIGNPLGKLTATMTAGYVSAKNRDVTTDGRTINMIQTDAAINSGNSGGPLFNMLGQVVGITTAKYSGPSSSGATIEGIGFAIPIDDVLGMVEDLVNYGYVTGAYLGVMVSDMDPEAAAYYGMPVGAYVQEVTPGYCAQRAGLQPKDIIVAVGEYEVKNISGLSRVLRNFKAGDTTTITVSRGGELQVLVITLDEKPRVTETEPTIEWPDDAENMPQDGSFEEWFNYFAPFFGYGKED